jgi:hypothetical protein
LRHAQHFGRLREALVSGSRDKASQRPQGRHLREQPVGEQLFLLHGFHL